MKNLIFILFIVGSMKDLTAQVFTRVLSKEQKVQDFFQYPIDKNTPYYKQPDINFERILEDDKRIGDPLKRVAVKVDQNYTTEDGLWSQYGDVMVWQIGFHAPKARSINLLMKDIVLPKESEMFVLSKKRDIIHGPVTPDIIYDKVYSTDIIESKEVLVLVKTNLSNKKEFNLTINGVCQGVPKISSLRDWGDAQDCQSDVNCPVGLGWENERDAVAVIIKDGAKICSGSLINNQCQDMRSFLLTGFHCLDGNNNKELSQSEKNLSTYTFRFKYEASSPSCPGPSTGTQGSWITYSGALFRAANVSSDFALIELNGSLINQPDIAVAGWNRDTARATSGVGIHHPSGDAKKISIFSTPPFRSIVGATACGGPLNGTKHWSVFWSQQGLPESGSSGSPLFDQNKRIVGQAIGGNSDCIPDNICNFTVYGRFDNSWNDGGTSETRLSDWLGTGNSPMTMNTISSPWIHPWVTNSGVEFVCTSNKVFSLNDPIPGRIISWSVSNPGLFATSGGAATSGSGQTATLRAASNSSQGSAVLTFTLSLSGCNNVTVTRNIWVGKPSLPATYPSGDPAIQLGVGQLSSVSLLGTSHSTGVFPFLGNWAAYGAVSVATPNPISHNTYTALYEGTGNFSVYTQNSCGISQTKWGAFNVTGNCNPCPRIIINNPIQNILNVEIPDYVFFEENGIVKKTTQGDFLLMDQSGQYIKSEKFYGKQHSTNVDFVKPGLYILNMRSDDFDLTEKVVIIK